VAQYKVKKQPAAAADGGWVTVSSPTSTTPDDDWRDASPALGGTPGGGIHTAPDPSLWDKANTGLISPDTIARTAMTGVSRDAAGMGMDELKSMRDEMNVGDNSAIMPTTLPTDINERKRVLAAAAPKFKARESQGETPFQAARRRGGAGTVMDAASTLSSFTSPVSIGMAGMGAIGKGASTVAPRVAQAARVGSRAAGIGFGVHGAQQAAAAAPNIDPTYQGITESPETLGFSANPEPLNQFLTGTSMASGGVADVADVGKVGMQKLRGSLSSRTAPNSGGLTTGDVYNEMRNRGVDMSIGQAGQGKTGRFVDEAVSRTPGGAGRMAKFRQKQGEQYAGAVKGIEDQFDPTGKGTDISEKGGQLQRALSMAKDVSHDNASQAFRDTLGDLQYTTADTTDIVNAAKAGRQKLAGTGQLDLMKNKQAADVLDEIINKYGDNHNNKSMVDDLFADRSRLMKAEFSDTLAPGEAEGIMRQMGGVMRKSLENAATSRGKLPEFNNAMSGWQDYIDTFGNKRSPVNQAIQQIDPTKVLEPFINSRGTGSLNAVRMLKRVAPDFVGMLKREVVRKLYDPKATGVAEKFGNMQNNLLQYNLPFLKELFTPEELKSLRAITAGGRSIGLEVNPSGSGTYGGQLASTATVLGGVGTGLVGLAQHNPMMAGLGAVGAAGLPVAANVGARVQTSQPIVDFLMGGGSSSAPAASGASLSTRPAGGTAVANPFGKAAQSIAKFHNDQAGTLTLGPDGEPVWPENYRNVDKTKPGGANYSPDDLERFKKEHGIEDKKVKDRIGEFHNDESGSVNVSALGSFLSKLVDHPDRTSLKAKKTFEKTDDVLSDEKKLTTLANTIVKAHNENGGSSIHPASGDMNGQDAFAVSAFPELQHVVEGDKITKAQVKEYLQRPAVQEALRSDPRTTVGTWADGGKTYIDVSAGISDLKAARDLGSQYDQKAIWDLKHGREVATGGSGSGKAPENATPIGERLKDVGVHDTLDAIHYSNEDNLSELDPAKFGSTGNTSETRIQRAFPDHYQPVSFLGDREAYRSSNERQITSKPNRYGSELNKSRYYDIHEDPEGLIDKAATAAAADGNYGNEALNAYLQKAIREQGYSGTVNGRTGVVTSWDKVPVSKEIIPEWADALLTKQERDSLKTEHTTRKFVTTLNSIPEVKDWVEAAKAGEIGRKWYQRGNAAFDALVKEAPDYFKDGDREKFANLVAATSPQQGVTQNIREALEVWKKWSDAGRPTDSSALQKLLDKNLTMAGSKVGNAVLALTDKSMWPSIEKSKYFKVPSFAQNLNRMLSHVTNDSWMGVFSGITEAAMPRPEHYHAVSVLTREAARQLGWKPAEAQAAIWVFTRTLAEMSGWKGSQKDFNPRSKLAGMTTEHMKAFADDFADIMANDPETRSLLKRLGVHLDSLDQKLEAIGHPTVAHGPESASQDSLGRTADRIGLANDVAKQTATKPVDKGEVQDEGGDTSFNTEALDEAPAVNRGGVEKASSLHRAELAAWNAKEGRAKDAATIANTIATKKDSDTVETYVSRRGNRSLGALQIDTYGSDKGYPLTIDWLATHPDVIEGRTHEKGIGTELFTHAVKRAAELGVGLQLESAEGARSFYEKMGMKPTEKTAKQYRLTKAQVKQLAVK
jgi:hypothetical protein